MEEEKPGDGGGGGRRDEEDEREFWLPRGHRPTENLETEGLEQASVDTRLGASNVGFRLMQKMGWNQAKEEDEEKERRQQQQHCFLLGTDLRLDKPSSAGAVDQKPLRPFFDEWPHEKAGNKGSWMGLEGETQLSISIPMAAHNDVPITTTSRYHHGE